MSLVRCDQISIEYGDTPLLLDADFSIEAGERVCLIGRNGAGKSTLLNIIGGKLSADRGQIQYRSNMRTSMLEQQLPDDTDLSVFDAVSAGLATQIELIEEYRRKTEIQADASLIHTLEQLQSRIEAGGSWQPDQQVEAIASRLNLPLHSLMSDLSGGWRRRVALARALVSKPELLLLDEPTNHLDFDTIEWLEHRLLGYQGSVIFITHDRNFLQRLATRIVEIDRGKLVSWPGSFDNYLQLKEKANEEEDARNALFDKRLAQEENWIRQGVKARRTRNEGRVRALHKLREERSRRLSRQKKARIQISEAEDSGRKVIEARSICHGYGDRKLLDNFRLKVMRGDRIGLIGNNGVGKSTLLKILLGHMQPDQGTVKLGTNLQIGYFDQVRRELDWEKTVAENVGNGREYVQVDGGDRHIVGYLRNFLFSPKRAMTPVKYLSGGECNRVLLAKMFTQANNLLVLDEPTNDLDVEMLEVLEEKLVEYQGTLILVSHDRSFLDNVVTSTLVFEDDGGVVEHAGGYSDWAAKGRSLGVVEGVGDGPGELKPQVAVAVASAPPSRKKLSYKFQRELDALPERIEVLEARIAEWQQQIGLAEFYDQPYDKTQPVLSGLTDAQSKLESLTERWFELEEMRG